MANQLKMGKKMIIYQLFEAGWSERKISKNTKIHRKTVHRYRIEWEEARKRHNSEASNKIDQPTTGQTAQNQAQSVPPEVPTGEVVHFQVPTGPTKKKKEASKSKVFRYDSIIREKLNGGQHARSIYQDLYTEELFRGSYDSVKRYVGKLKSNHPKLFARLETAFGEEAQVDFGQGAATLKNGRYCKPWLFVMTLSNSRHSYQEAVWGQDVETFLGCHEHAFLFFGGVVKTIRIDNLKSGVLKAHLYEPELNPNYLAFSQHHNFVILPCRVRTPQHKGKVESNIKYVQNNALTNRKFESLEAQNAYLRLWNHSWAYTRIHGTTKRQVKQMFEAERPYLQSLAEQPFAFFNICNRKVNVMDSHVQIEGAYYPVTPKYMGRKVKVHYNQNWVKIYSGSTLIQHLSRVKKGCFHPDRSCFPAKKNFSQEKYQKYQMSQCQTLGKSVLAWAKACREERGVQSIRAIQGVLSLHKKYPAESLDRACATTLQANIFNYNAVRINVEMLVAQQQQQRELELVQESEMIRTPNTYAKILEGEQ